MVVIFNDYTAGNNVFFLPETLEKVHFSDSLARIAALPQWTPCICFTYSPERKGRLAILNAC